MTDVDRWFPAWLKRHLALHARSDWPDPAEPDGWQFYLGWLWSFRARRFTEAEANEASARLQECSPRFVVDHLPALLEHVAVRRERRIADAPRPPRRPPPDAPTPEDLARWDELDECRRGEILAVVRARNPGLARFPGLMVPLCVEELRRRVGEMVES